VQVPVGVNALRNDAQAAMAIATACAQATSGALWLAVMALARLDVAPPPTV